MEERYDKLHAQKWDRVEGAHLITNEMIDAAVDLIENLYSSDDQRHGLGIIEVAKSYMWKALNKLGIFRCEGCGGSGKKADGGAAFVHVCLDCANWGSKGWVIGKEKDDGMD